MIMIIKMIIKMLTGNSTVTSRNGGDKLLMITHRAGNEQVNIGTILFSCQRAGGTTKFLINDGLAVIYRRDPSYQLTMFWCETEASAPVSENPKKAAKTQNLKIMLTFPNFTNLLWPCEPTC